MPTQQHVSPHQHVSSYRVPIVLGQPSPHVPSRPGDDPRIKFAVAHPDVLQRRLGRDGSVPLEPCRSDGSR
jgi:hypothetical protein